MPRICFVRAVPTDETEQVGAAAAAGSTGTPHTPPGRKVRGLPGRVWQQFWRGDELRDASQPMDARRAEFLRRARLAAEVARRTSESSEPFVGSVDGIVCDLYRQSIHWSLEGLNGTATAQSDPTDGPRTSHWGALDRSTLLKAAGGEGAFASVMNAVGASSFEAFTVLAPEERTRLLRALQAVSSLLIAELEISKRVVEALWLQRVLRLGLLFALALVVFVTFARLRDRAEQRRDLAIGKAWRTSSWYGGCHSPEQDCLDSPDYFFHTQEEKSPWVELDLGSKQRFSGVRIDNRRDCCTDRATPLVIEVSNDQQKWQTVARREDVFNSWLAKLAPTEARWVRVRAEKKAPLHLAHVRVLR